MRSKIAELSHGLEGRFDDHHALIRRSPSRPRAAAAPWDHHLGSAIGTCHLPGLRRRQAGWPHGRHATGNTSSARHPESGRRWRRRRKPSPSGSLLSTDVEVQAAACTDGVDQGLQLRRRGRLGPCGPPALQHGPRGKPGAHGAQRSRPGRRRRRHGGARPPSLRRRVQAAARHPAAGDRRTRRPSRSRTRS
jgi:hypothetical protein